MARTKRAAAAMALTREQEIFPMYRYAAMPSVCATVRPC